MEPLVPENRQAGFYRKEEGKAFRVLDVAVALDVPVEVLQSHLLQPQTNTEPIYGPIPYLLILVALNIILWSEVGWLQYYLRRTTERRGRGAVSQEGKANPQAKWSSVSESIVQISHIYRLYSESSGHHRT